VWKVLTPFELPEDTSESDFADFKAGDYVKQYISEDVFALMADCSNMKFVIDTGKNLNVTAVEMKRFFGITILSCIGYCRIKMYWKKALQVPLIAGAMNHYRYFRVRNNLKIAKDYDVTDKQKECPTACRRTDAHPVQLCALHQHAVIVGLRDTEMQSGVKNFFARNGDWTRVMTEFAN